MINTNNIQKIFNNYFLIQLLLNITNTICSISNGYIAGNFLDNIAVTCNSLISPLNLTIVSIAYIFSSASQILCGRFLGNGDRKSLNITFTYTIILSSLVSLLFYLLILLLPDLILKFSGANLEILPSAKQYLNGYSIGIFSYILTPVIITFLNIENEGKYVTKSVIFLTITHIALGYIFIKFLNLSYFGLGLTSSLSKILTLIFLLIQIYRNRKQIFFTKIEYNFYFIKKIFSLGLPSGYSGVLLSLRNIVFNNILISYGGMVSLAAKSVQVSCLAFQNAFTTSALNATMTISSICIGEKNKENLIELIKHIFTRLVPFSIFLILIQFSLSQQLASIFTKDIATSYLSSIVIKLYLISNFFEIINDCLISFYTVFEDYKFINFFNIMHNIVLHLLFVFITMNFLKEYSVYISYIFAEVFSILIFYIYSCIKNKRLTKKYYDLVVIDKAFDEIKKLNIKINSFEQVTKISETIIDFCFKNTKDSRKSFLSGLCAEEMITNIFEHGYTKKGIKHKYVDVFVIIENNTITLRIRDNSIPFDPETRTIIFNPEDPCKNIGLRIVKNISSEMTYQNLFGLNNTIIKI